MRMSQIPGRPVACGGPYSCLCSCVWVTSSRNIETCCLESDIIAMRRELRGRVCQCARACVCVRVSVKSVLTHVCLYIVAVCTLVGMHACMCM